ncbi:CMGC family protein kinase [Trichomonas vaginalis G3]|uniref:non-specific serine/threonine protein kinase n=1 Tax=Trichomonas vaginalis (strain ATCC PRA-98 / G3) TaxID=412133 RepID=A2ESP0_TRIV3|nr:protein serine/threonine kinase protein [Trichomonas vaginalis G3]EAY04349.1 CMGC family protein kinase [Trichomonas vaginalis G3]KAI5551922.1 protein serine/threonine kinase protein [Trichomonas vaginalis G3]|eukprot:XP_001316572.1 CMGC family protein kinase [Trichomonas vaginalis G3]
MIFYFIFNSLSSASVTNSADGDDEFTKPWMIHQNYSIDFLPEEGLKYNKKLGSGKFSEVFSGNLENGTEVAIKKLKPTERWRLNREIRILATLQHIPQVIRLYGVYGDDSYPIVVTELGKTTNPNILTLDQLKWLLRELFDCLNKTHHQNIFHRDIKWQNILVDFQTQKLRVIDWGLADYMNPKFNFSCSVGTKSYKAPELLMGYKKYDEAVDIWASGCILANLLFGCSAFFAANDNDGVFNRQVKFFGYNKMTQINEVLNTSKSIPYYGKQSFMEYVLPHTKHLINKETIGLVTKILNPDPFKRPTADEILRDDFLYQKKK